MLAVRGGRWKLLINPDRSRVELHAIPADPGAIANLAGAQPDAVRNLRESLLTWQQAAARGSRRADGRPQRLAVAVKWSARPHREKVKI